MPQSGSWAVNYANLQRMTKAQRLARARQQQRLARAANYRAGYRTVARTRGVYAKGEMKYFDTSFGATALAATTTSWPAGSNVNPTTPLCLLAPTVGAAINQRIGREVKVFKIKIKGYFNTPTQASQSGGDTASLIRLLLVMDTQTNAAACTAAQVIADGSNAGTTIESFQNLANVGRFRVLRDKQVIFGNSTIANDTGATGGIVQSGQKRKFKIVHRFMKPVSVRFNATNGGTIADIVDNSFHLFCATDSTALAPALTYSARVCYKE